ncbi:MAG: hypothetical protein IJB33_06585 [Akkermansia sp.]|nr:hypothetical protein [Akkermansia sp.]
MFNARVIVGVLLFVGLLCMVFIPDWFEDPVKLAPGEWKGTPNGMLGEVDESQVRWSVGGHRGRFVYNWVQTENEPYRVQFRRGNRVFEAEVEFNGRDEAVVHPLIFDELPELAQDYIRSRNKAMNRPENEMIFVFHRIKRK